MQIHVTQSSLPPFEEYIDEIRSIWGTKWLTNMGEKHFQLEQELEAYLEVPFISLFTNGHLALETAIEALELTGEVITTPFTFASTTHAITRNGLTPVFCDIRPDDYTLDVDKIESLITEKTSAIIAVHVYGNVCNIQEINRIANKHNLKVIYDAAHAFGVTVNGQGIGNFGDISMFSFHATKVFNSIEGGALTFSDEAYKNKFYQIKNFGIVSPEAVVYAGGNGKMNEFSAAMGICNIRYIDQNIKSRKAVVERYKERLQGVKGLRLLQEQDGVSSNYAYFPVIFDENILKRTRDEVSMALAQQNIMARKYFYPLTNDYECYSGRFDSNTTPVARYIAERVLTLPLYAELAPQDIDRICDIVLGQ
ncbi:DegT/DnrJ/EryC1/StrS family aminotransferase [Paenibacillus lutrae]|uniref:Aminotransferase class I/II-fold pyridoxal phosphate-dependent enzyme n=1 Tax=Paenibacillus lutrae TaxID=2078573 RepID=A0A7X3FJ37_9BACL|nr:DegT/DnrJ/EryC1/StrS family aminotransferase [Paenibacillus lutrae]MVP00665.1 aminotransferase class I/II-fold pyridoxal phosphate-dependent enzyme [Paenibacillus lutrae]